MENKTPNNSLFIAQPGLPTEIPTRVQYPLADFYRYEVSFLQQLFNVPLYPDRTNINLENTRAQIRYRLFPVIEVLGFDFATKQKAHALAATPRKFVNVSTRQQTTSTTEITPGIQALVLATKNRVKFELPGTRTPNCPIKSRELYH